MTLRTALGECLLLFDDQPVNGYLGGAEGMDRRRSRIAGRLKKSYLLRPDGNLYPGDEGLMPRRWAISSRSRAARSYSSVATASASCSARVLPT